MTVISDLTSEEQRLLLSSLDAAAITVSAASPGRKEETASEGFAAMELILASEDAYVSNPLVLSTILMIRHRARQDQPFPDYVKLASAVDARDRAVAILRQVVTLLDAKATPAEAAGFKAWLNGVAAKVAEASTEGGFLGFGGVKVSEAEKATLADIAAALGTGAHA